MMRKHVLVTKRFRTKLAESMSRLKRAVAALPVSRLRFSGSHGLESALPAGAQFGLGSQALLPNVSHVRFDLVGIPVPILPMAFFALLAGTCELKL